MIAKDDAWGCVLIVDACAGDGDQNDHHAVTQHDEGHMTMAVSASTVTWMDKFLCSACLQNCGSSVRKFKVMPHSLSGANA